MARSNQVMSTRPELERAFGFSQIARSGNLIFVSGSVAMDEHGNLKGGPSMREQVHTVYSDLAVILARLGAKFENVVKETVYTVDIDALVDARDARGRFFEDCAPPASCWVEVRKLFKPEFLLEVELTVEAP
jgi:2-iminobutanoate/2-iminopropanoate deaminase